MAQGRPSRLASALGRFALLLGLSLRPAAAEVQIGLGSNLQTVTLTATKPSSVTISLPAGQTATLPGPLLAGVNDLPPIAIETGWEVDPSHTASVSLVAYFEQPTRALVSGAGAIPANAVQARMPAGTAQSFTTFAGVPIVAGGTEAGVAGASVVLFTTPIGPANAIGFRADHLQVRIDLTQFPALPAGTYTGTLHLVAVTQ